MTRELMWFFFRLLLPIYVFLYFWFGLLYSYGTNENLAIKNKEIIAHTVVSQLEFTYFMLYPKKIRGTNFFQFKHTATELDFNCLKNKWIKKSIYFKTLDFLLDFKKDSNGNLITDYENPNIISYSVTTEEDCKKYEYEGTNPQKIEKKRKVVLKTVDNRKNN
jgi:hypothetical protein